jgi:hypothetical protein
MTAPPVLRELVRPTARAIAWTPVLAVSVGLLSIAALLRLADRPVDVVLGVGAAATASALVFALDDPAARLLAPLPTSAMTRRLLRLALVAAVAVPSWLLVAALLPGDGLGLLPLLALTSTGVAVATRLRPGVSVAPAAAAPLLWVAAGQLVGGALGIVGDVATLWQTHPAYVAAAGLALVVAGRHR